MSCLRVENLYQLNGGPLKQPVNLGLDSGQCTFLSGDSGAGKTSLLRMMADLDQHAGELWLDDVSSMSISGSSWRQQVAYLAAESHWWHDKVGSHFIAADQIRFEMLGLDMKILQSQVAHCSTGERQRLALLRLLENNPAVLLLDEPTASLDAMNSERVEALINAYRKKSNTAVLWVSHDARQIERLADKHYFLSNNILQQVGK